MYPDLVHASRVRKAQDHADVGLLVVADQLECRRTVFALAGHLAHAYLVTDHFDGMIALDRLPVSYRKCVYYAFTSYRSRARHNDGMPGSARATVCTCRRLTRHTRLPSRLES